MNLDDWDTARDLLADLTDHLARIADDDLDPAARTALWHLGPVRTDIVHRIAQLEAPGQLALPT